MSLSFASASMDKPRTGFSTNQVAPGLYLLTKEGGITSGNIALSVGEDGVVMIDDSVPPLLTPMREAIRSITGKPVDFLINTHFHRDHAGNNGALGELGAQIFAHDNTRKRLITGAKTSSSAALPVFTFSHQMNFHLNGNDIHIIHVANAHTDGDVIIYFKNLNVIHAGDTFLNAKFPYIDHQRGGSISGLITAQKKILSLSNPQTKIIPGHGALASQADLQASIAMLTTSKQRISLLIASEMSEDEVVRINPLSDFHEPWNRRFITTERMTRQVYQSLKKEAR